MNFFCRKLFCISQNYVPTIFYIQTRFAKIIVKGGDHIVNDKIKISILLAVLFTFFIFAGFPQMYALAKETAGKKEATQQKGKKNPYANAEITTKIIPSANKTFGYEILLHGKTLMRQPGIPALPGNDGFITKARAQKVADFVVKKIRKNEMPPTVTIEDLKKMGVLKKDQVTNKMLK
ncbi:MAG: DUF4907 domain-containing protein [Deltaproteobacteria bacterium]|nr:DUF4907 domain-containing protein [Deltaproteobacteria bacterium]